MKTTILNFWEKRKEYLRVRKQKMVERSAEDIYQLTEHNGDLWLTYRGSLIAPCNVLGTDASLDSCIELLKTIRKLYIARSV